MDLVFGWIAGIGLRAGMTQTLGISILNTSIWFADLEIMDMRIGQAG